MWTDRILFIDAEALVIDKPAGLAVHAGPKTPYSLDDHLPALRFGFRRPPSPVHRLDRDTSGCLLLSRNPKAHKRFAKAFEDGRVEKLYLAVLEGALAGAGAIDMPLLKVSSREQGWRMSADPNGQSARTHWRAIAQEGGRTLVAFTPETGRTHQIRAHAAFALDAPVVGDPIYGKAAPAMLLHAATLTVPRENKEPVSAISKLPLSFGSFRDAA
ncbi:MAG TPA: RNA pseudouridine synthase [Allosphingosinicella sp.]|jgi:tRNA pseudouridine32 synthase/23S rRNA pseudouridine746 synthase